MTPDDQIYFSFVKEEREELYLFPREEAPKPSAGKGLAALGEEARGCRKCGLRAGCRGVVFGEGNESASVMLVGEAPGAVEDEMGRPFVGPAGQLLDRILKAAGFAREDVYITNCVKCRPPGNRIPAPQEISACMPYLEEQVRIIAPSILVCLGATSTRALLGRNLPITEVHGRWFFYRDIPLIPTFHPAALLRDPSKKKPVWEDFLKVREEYYKRCRLRQGESLIP
ncbi:MAG: uracil-DNA glycosylase [Bacillota bacterium]